MEPVDSNKELEASNEQNLIENDKIPSEQSTMLNLIKTESTEDIVNEEFEAEELLFSADKLKELMNSFQQKFVQEQNRSELDEKGLSEEQAGELCMEEQKFDETLYSQMISPYVDLQQQENLEAAIRALEIPNVSDPSSQTNNITVEPNIAGSSTKKGSIFKNTLASSNQLEGHNALVDELNVVTTKDIQLNDYFIRPEIAGMKNNQSCKLCNKRYKVSSSVDTLSGHLLKVHSISVSAPKHKVKKAKLSFLKPRYSTTESNGFMKYFSLTKDENGSDKNKCDLCDAIFGSTNTTYDLQRHIQLSHAAAAFKEGLINTSTFQNIAPHPTSDNKEDDTSLEIMPYEPYGNSERKFKYRELSSNIWSHYKVVNGKDRTWSDAMMKRCNHCQRSYSITTSNTTLARHLTVTHGIALPNYRFNLKKLKVDFDNLNNGDNLIPIATPEVDKVIESDLEKITEPIPNVDPPLGPHPINYELEMSCRLALLCKWITSNPDPAAILESTHFQNLIYYLDPQLKLPDLELCKALAHPLQEYHNSKAPGNARNVKSSLQCLFHRKENIKICIYCHAQFANKTNLGEITKHLILNHHDRYNNTNGMYLPALPSQLKCLNHFVVQFIGKESRPCSIFEQELFKKYLVFNRIHSDAFASSQLEIMVDHLYKDAYAKKEDLISTALTQFSAVVDLFNVDSSSLLVGVSLCFVDRDWQPRKVLISSTKVKSQLDTVSCDIVSGVVIQSIERFSAYHPKINGLVINAGIRGEIFGSHLEGKINAKFGSDCWTLNCMSKLIDDAIFFTLLDHPIVVSLRKAASNMLQKEKQRLSEDSYIYKILAQNDWRDLVKCLLEGRADLISIISKELEYIPISAWDDLDKYLERIGTVLKSATAFHSSPYLNLSEAHVVFMGLANQLQELAGKTCPRVARLIEYISKRHPESTGRQVVVSILLDPRFKFQAFGDSVNQEAVLGRLRELFVSYTLNRLRSQPIDLVNDRTAPATIGVTLLARRLSVDNSISPTLNDEMDLYLKTPPIPPNMDPFKWWYTHQHEYPVLHRVAIEHLALPATGNLLLTQQSTLTLPQNQSNLKDLEKFWAIGHLN